MPNLEHIERLGAGGRAWNRWRTRSPHVTPNLSGADLRGRNLRGFDLTRADLRNADLRGAQLDGAQIAFGKLQRAAIAGASLRKTKLFRASLQGANIERAVCSFSDLSQARLTGAYGAQAVFRHARLTGAFLDYARLGGADFSSASLKKASLRSAVMTAGTFQGVDVEGANLRGADFRLSVFNPKNPLFSRPANVNGARFTLPLTDPAVRSWLTSHGARLEGDALILGEDVDALAVVRHDPSAFRELLLALDDETLAWNRVDPATEPSVADAGRAEVKPDEKVEEEVRPAPPGRLVTVWFGTNRKKDGEGKDIRFTGERDEQAVHHGRCHVFVPEHRKMGSIGSPWWKRVGARYDDRVQMRGTELLAESDFWTALRDTVSEEDAGLLFLHGYNVSFAGAAIRSAQLCVDLDVRGPVAFFSWPSRGRLFSYPADEAAVEASEGAVGDFLQSFAERTGLRTVHVLAHSMGNRALLRCVNALVSRLAERSRGLLGQIILAAPDVDRGTFQQLATAYREIGERTTLYASAKDLALSLSGVLHRFERAGYVPPVTVVDGLDTILASAVDLSLIGHGYVSEVRPVLGDIFSLIRHGHPPSERAGLLARTDTSGRQYWLFRA